MKRTIASSSNPSTIRCNRKTVGRVRCHRREFYTYTFFFYILIRIVRVYPRARFVSFLRDTKLFYVNLVDRLLFYVRMIRFIYSFGLHSPIEYIPYIQIIMVHFHKSESCVLFYATPVLEDPETGSRETKTDTSWGGRRNNKPLLQPPYLPGISDRLTL